jgi:hypothetical protein
MRETTVAMALFAMPMSLLLGTPTPSPRNPIAPELRLLVASFGEGG